jgi:hypothetical protein
MNENRFGKIPYRSARITLGHFEDGSTDVGVDAGTGNTCRTLSSLSEN